MNNHPLNALCPYYTMFPLSYPMGQLVRERRGSWVLDPFCGRGTTAFAAMLRGLNIVSCDISSVAVAITRSKLARVHPQEIVNLAQDLISNQEVTKTPQDDYWDLAYNKDVLHQICAIREGLLERDDGPANALRGVVMGALHGPNGKTPCYFSNQMQRTFAPKPDYAVRYWRRHNLKPQKVDLLSIIKRKAERAYGDDIDLVGEGMVLQHDSRELPDTGVRFSHVVTSPPYLGMQTYGPDQWLREWFIGGPSRPNYNQAGQIGFSGYENIVKSLSQVWLRSAELSLPKARLSIRFGGFGKQQVDVRELVVESVKQADVGWRHIFTRDAGSPSRQRRQANQMGKKVKNDSSGDYDFRFMLS